MGSGGGSVGRAVAYDTRDPRFKSQHRQNLFTNGNQIEKTKKEKEAGNGPSKKLWWLDIKKLKVSQKSPGLVLMYDECLAENYKL